MYELLFWKYQDQIYLNNHIVYQSLVAQETVNGLEDLPTTVIINRIENVFKTWQKIDTNSWKNTNGPGAFQIKSTPQSIQIDCYGTHGKTMDQLVQILDEFQCPLYDPQIPVRYDDI